MASKITHAEVLAAQIGRTDALLQISADYQSGGFDKAKATADAIIEAAYTYQFGAVAFKPTLTVAPQTFRPTFDGALSYFVGGNPDFPNDKGFGLGDHTDTGLKQWISTAVNNNAIQILDKNSAVSMGNVSFVNSEGTVTTVDKTWGWEKYPDGSIRIHLHHSSLPNGDPVSTKELPDVITGQIARSTKSFGSWDVDEISGGEFDGDGLYSLSKNKKTLTLYSDQNSNGKIDSFDLAVGFAEIEQAGGKLAGWDWVSSSDTGNIYGKSGNVLGTLVVLDTGIF